MKKLRDDEEFKDCVATFFPLAKAAAVGAADFDPTDLLDLGRSGFAVRFMHGIYFVISPEIESAQIRLVSRTLKLLGPKDGNENEIKEIAWKVVHESVEGQEQTDDFQAIKNRFVEKISQNKDRNFVYICPNYAIEFDEGINKIIVGPVQAIHSSSLAPTIFKGIKTDFSAVAGNKFSIEFRPKEPRTLTLSPVSWRVEVKAAQANVPEEASWLINIALSLIRFSCKNWTPFFPRYGDREAMPTTPHIVESQYVITEGLNWYGGSISGANFYRVDKALQKTTRSEKFKNRCKAIFSPKNESLAVPFGQGLGWLTRARQTDDRAERLLYFFTAIEALLSKSDKSAPIVQTVARNVATILTDDPHERPKIVKTVKSLYDYRSALVHNGEKKVSNIDVDKLQKIAERLFYTVMEEVPLGQNFDKFHESLDKAGYGLKWP